MIDLDQIGADIQYVRKHKNGDIAFTVLLNGEVFHVSCNHSGKKCFGRYRLNGHVISGKKLAEMCDFPPGYLLGVSDGIIASCDVDSFCNTFEDAVIHTQEAIDGLIRKACGVIEEEIESIIDEKVFDSGSIIVRQIDTFGIGWEAPKKLSRLKEIELQEIYVSKEEEGVIYFLTKDEDIVYVGQSGMATCGDRINRHIKDGKEFNRSFYFTVKKEKLNFTEQFFIKKFQPKYNTSHNIQNMAV